jgi:hypothetical protein
VVGATLNLTAHACEFGEVFCAEAMRESDAAPFIMSNTPNARIMQAPSAAANQLSTRLSRARITDLPFCR